LICALALAVASGLGAAAGTMPSAPAGVVETGAPSFVVMGPEALGLSSAPLDLHLMPDGRVLVVSELEIAFGDGVRWDTYLGEDEQQRMSSSVAVDTDGQIYAGLTGAIARLDLTSAGRWRYTEVVAAPTGASLEKTDLRWVSQLHNQWYWFGGSGTIVSWMPGQAAAVSGRVGGVDRVFARGNDVFASEGTSGGLYRLRTGAAPERVTAADTLVSETVTCAMPFGADQLLVGTASMGLKLFDGKTLRPFGPAGLLSNGHRIMDLCPIGDRFFAAAVDTIGIIFFDREGRTVQALERSLDHRLARVRLLRYSAVGVLWALMDDGVARVEFPSPISHFEPLMPSGLSYAQPLRHEGKLWVLADGRAMRGVYNSYGPLERFVDDTPPGRFLYTLLDVDGQLFGGNEQGIWIYDAAGWRAVVPGIVNARISVAKSTGGAMYYVARGEFGVIRPVGQGFTARRIAVPNLADSYGAVIDAAGIGWIELGVSRIGRFDPNGGDPRLRIFGRAEGLGDGWIEPYVLDGVARFHWGDSVARFDDTRQVFVPDRELVAQYPEMAIAGGRPEMDGLGRLWFSNRKTAQMIDRSATGANRSTEIAHLGFAPTSCTPETNGVVWMFARRNLARVDLRIPAPPAVRPSAMITSVQFPADGRQVFSPGATLGPLKYADNSLVIHFAAPSNPFSAPVTFEVLLEGLGDRWVSTGAVGSEAFTQLKEGDYVFRVRPVTGGSALGLEARLAFTVRPPWYRSPVAWAAYAAAVLGALAFVIWLSSYLQRRENVRLEHLVAERTAELNATNEHLGRQIAETTEKSAALSVSEERYRLLNSELEKRVADRTAQLEATLEQLAQARKMEAMGQLAGGVAHDFNNILTAMLMQIGLISENTEVAPEVKGGINQLEVMARRAANLTRRLLTFSRQQVVQIEVINIETVIDNLLQMLRSLLHENVELIRRRAAAPLWVEGDVGLIEQIVTNLCVNARDAMMPRGGRLTIGTERVTIDEGAAKTNLDARPGNFVRLVVEDEGSGMDAAVLQHIFEPFFTTKEMGTGLGLATVYGIAKQHHGWVEVRSEIGKGSAFMVYLPEVQRGPAPKTAAAPAGATGGHGCILLVEDEIAVRTAASRMLKRIGYRVLEAVDGEDAIRVWSEHSQEIDLLFSDMVMPKGHSGLELAARFKAERPQLKVVITSGYSVDLTKERVLDVPGVAFLPKPYPFDGLADVLRRSLNEAT
jgi:signal transduction histidine kinase/ActR/RegA family two-component response regulator